MKRYKETRVLNRSAFAASLTASLCLGFAAPLLAASSPKTDAESQSRKTDAAFNMKPARKCLTDLRAFDGQMQKDGYWLSGSGYGYGSD